MESKTGSDLDIASVDIERQDLPIYQSEEFLEKLEKLQTVEQHDRDLDPPASTIVESESVRTYSGLRWFLVCVALYITSFLYGTDNTIVASIQAPIIESFDSIETLGWLGIGFPLGSIACILAIGKAYGTFDVKCVHIVSLVQFAAGSALCGAAPNMNAEIIGRVWAGVGGAGSYLGFLNILSINTTPKERSVYIALCAFTWGLGCVIGPVIGGCFADSSRNGWRWAFYINLIIFAVASPVVLFVIKSYNPDPDRTFCQKARDLDWIGICLNAGIFVIFIIGISFGGVLWKWNDASTIALLVVSSSLIVLFAVQQTFSIFTTPQHRIFPIDFLKSRDLVLQFIVVSTNTTGLFISIYYIPIYFAFTRGDTAIDAAVRLLPFMFVAITFYMINGIYLPRFGGLYAPWFLAGGIFMLAGGASLYAVLSPSTSNSAIYGLSILVAIGTGLIGQAPYSVAQSKVPVNRIADAVGFINQGQIGAIAISLSITGAKSSILETASDEVKAVVLAGIVTAISQGFVLLFTAGAVAIVASLLMTWEEIFDMETAAGG